MATTTTTEAKPTPCGPYLEALLIRAAEALDHQLIPAWDDAGRLELSSLRSGQVRPWWTGGRRRHLARTDYMAISALLSFAAEAQGPAWANTEASDARRLADAIREGRCAVWS